MKKKSNPLVAVTMICLLSTSCNSQESSTFSNKKEYTNQVGDIVFDAKIDNPDFTICDANRIPQYYMAGKGPRYTGEKIDLINHFITNYDSSSGNTENGYITIRFIINCMGRSGRYRVSQMDEFWKEKVFNTKIVDQLVALTTQVNSWEIFKQNDKAFDYYQYLTFKIENGNISEILP